MTVQVLCLLSQLWLIITGTREIKKCSDAFTVTACVWLLKASVSHVVLQLTSQLKHIDQSSEYSLDQSFNNLKMSIRTSKLIVNNYSIITLVAN